MLALFGWFAADKELMSSPDANKSWCFTCGVLAGEQQVPGGAPVWHSEKVVANHHEDPEPKLVYPKSRAGWIVVAPVRHVVRVYDLTAEEWAELGKVIRAVDLGLTHLYGSRRTMVASLGWENRDHIHFHCVPTFGEEISQGSLNFDGAYVPPPVSSDTVAFSLRHFLQDILSPNGAGK